MIPPTTFTEVTLQKLVATKAYSAFVFEASLHGKKRELTIYTEPHVVKHLQLFFAGETKQVPRSLDFFSLFTDAANWEITRARITAKTERAFEATLLLQSKSAENSYIEITGRPSDALSLALMQGAPIFCNPSLLSSA